MKFITHKMEVGFAERIHKMNKIMQFSRVCRVLTIYTKFHSQRPKLTIRVLVHIHNT